jgi:hypothetical protein
MQHLSCTWDHEFAHFNALPPKPFAMRAQGASQWRNGAGTCPDRVVLALIDLLAGRFPVVRHLAGEQSFLGASCAYALTQPSRSASPLRYGEAFPTFLRSIGDCASIEYLADIAALEWARHTARYAAQAVVDRLQLPRRSTAQFSALRIALHPSVSLIASRFPIVTIWEANLSSGEAPVICCWKPEPALVARPFRIVEIRRRPPGGYAFLEALRRGVTIGDAAEAGGAAAAGFDLASNLALLAESKIAIGFR